MQHAETAIHRSADAGSRRTPLPLRDDTLLGVCEAISEDFGIPANLLRIAFAAGLLWNAYAVVGLYLGLGVIVAVSRLLFPKPAIAGTESGPSQAARNDEERVALAA